MGSFYSRLYYASLFYLSNHFHFALDWLSLVQWFQSHSNQRVRDLTRIYKQGELSLHWGRQLAFFRLVKELRVTEEEWNELIHALNY